MSIKSGSPAVDCCLMVMQGFLMHKKTPQFWYGLDFGLKEGTVMFLLILIFGGLSIWLESEDFLPLKYLYSCYYAIVFLK